MDEILFTPSAVMGILSQIEELKGKSISFEEIEGGCVQFTIGTNSYFIDPESAQSVEVTEDVIEDVAEANQEGYEALQDDGVDFASDEVIEGGILKELAKTLLIGGMVRLTNKMITQDQIDAIAKKQKR